MSTKQKNIVIIATTMLVLVLLLVVVVFTGKIPLNDITVTGNTPGNLNNNGYFCENGDTVYFANAYDNYALYSMSADETGLKRINENSVSHICTGGKYLYYAMSSNSSGSGLGFMRKTSGIYRSKLNGNSTVCLDRCHIVSMQLCGSYVYYEKYDNKLGPSLEKIRIDKKKKETVEKQIISPTCYADGVIYFHGTEKDHYLHALNTANGAFSTVWKNNMWNPIYQDRYVYYMDISNDYRLCRYSFADDVIEILTNERIDTFNVYGNVIYYQVSSKDAPALKRMNIDGSAQELVREGIYENINITSHNVYFNSFSEPTPVYKTSTYGPINVTSFDVAMQAALANIKK